MEHKRRGAGWVGEADLPALERTPGRRLAGLPLSSPPPFRRPQTAFVPEKRSHRLPLTPPSSASQGCSERTRDRKAASSPPQLQIAPKRFLQFRCACLSRPCRTIRSTPAAATAACTAAVARMHIRGPGGAILCRCCCPATAAGTQGAPALPPSKVGIWRPFRQHRLHPPQRSQHHPAVRKRLRVGGGGRSGLRKNLERSSL